MRHEVLKRDGHRCQACGRSRRHLHVHHILHRSRGGPTVPWNLLTLCLRCHGLVHDEKIELFGVYRVRRPLRWAAMGIEILPGVFLGARVMLSIAIVISVVTEMITAPTSPWALGALARDSLMAFNTARYFAAMLIIGICGYVSNLLMRLVESWLGGMKVGLEEVLPAELETITG